MRGTTKEKKAEVKKRNGIRRRRKGKEREKENTTPVCTLTIYSCLASSFLLSSFAPLCQSSYLRCRSVSAYPCPSPPSRSSSCLMLRGLPLRSMGHSLSLGSNTPTHIRSPSRLLRVARTAPRFDASLRFLVPFSRSFLICVAIGPGSLVF